VYSPPRNEQEGLAASISCGLGAGLAIAAARLTGATPEVKHCLLMQLLKAAAMTATLADNCTLDDGRLKQTPHHRTQSIYTLIDTSSLTASNETSGAALQNAVVKNAVAWWLSLISSTILRKGLAPEV
jgi:hypothetical protein